LTLTINRCIHIYTTMTDTDRVLQLPCACTSMRRATRAVTRLYDRELRETGLRSTQFTLLQALHLAGELTQGELGSLLSLDSTTLTRSLRTLIDDGWVKSARGEDRRERHLRLTASGERKYQDALPAWRRAQNQLRKTIGRDWERLERDLRQITGSVT
jgi:DNA-binding MarR family transcriptional regulator